MHTIRKLVQLCQKLSAPILSRIFTNSSELGNEGDRLPALFSNEFGKLEHCIIHMANGGFCYRNGENELNVNTWYVIEYKQHFTENKVSSKFGI